MPQICFNLSKSISGIWYNHPRRILKRRSAVKKPGLNACFHVTRSQHTSNSSLSAPLEATKVQSLFVGATLRKNCIINSLLLHQKETWQALRLTGRPLFESSQACLFVGGSRIKTQPARSHFLLQLQGSRRKRKRRPRQRQVWFIHEAPAWIKHADNSRNFRADTQARRGGGNSEEKNIKKARPVTTPTHDAAQPRVSRRNINNKKKRASENCERLAQRVGDLQSEDEYVRVNFAAIPIRVGVWLKFISLTYSYDASPQTNQQTLRCPGDMNNSLKFY